MSTNSQSGTTRPTHRGSAFDQQKKTKTKKAKLKLYVRLKRDKLSYVCREKKASWGWLNSQEGLRWTESFAGSTEPWRRAGRLQLNPPASSDRPHLTSVQQAGQTVEFCCEMTSRSLITSNEQAGKLAVDMLVPSYLHGWHSLESRVQWQNIPFETNTHKRIIFFNKML